MSQWNMHWMTDLTTRESFEIHLQTLIAEDNFFKLVSECENFELESSQNGMMPLYSVHLLGYLIIDDLVNARYLWKRIPDEIKKVDTEICAIWNIGKSLWLEDTVSFYKNIHSYAWENLTSTLVDILKAKYSERTIELLSNAYSIVTLDTICQHLGLSSGDAINLVKSRGWEEVDGMFKPVPFVQKEGPSPNIKNLQSLTDYVVFLET